MEMYKLNYYDIDFIESLIRNEIEESINIEFKSGEALSKNDTKKKEISKDISALANSNGGIIIYGINELNHKASSISFIDGNEFSKEWLEQVINSTIQRSIPDIKIYPIRKDGDIFKTLYVVQVPESLEAPHIAKDKKFYKRYNFESVAMEEYEIRQLYGRKVTSKLIIEDYILRYKKVNEAITFTVECLILNEGEQPEKDYKLNLYLEGHPKDFVVSWAQLGNGKNYEYTSLEEGYTKITSPSICSIYQDETITAIRIEFEISIEKLKEILTNLKIKFLLLYSNGQDKMEINNLVDCYLEIKENVLDE